MTPSQRYNRVMRRVFPASILLFAAALAVSAAAQANGVPPSVMSFGPGRGMAPGVPASVTSLGPLGYTPQWNIQPLFPMNPIARPPHHPHPGHGPGVGQQPFYGGGYYWGGGYGYGYSQPVIMVPTQEADDEDGGGPTIFDRRGPRRPASYYDEREERAATKEIEPAHPKVDTPPPPEPAVQPKTVLIYRDGHQGEVQNYAIVGDHLIDFGETRRRIALASLDLPATVKANDERGVDFTLPVSTKAR
jgi:hypothetical protein